MGVGWDALLESNYSNQNYCHNNYYWRNLIDSENTVPLCFLFITGRTTM